MAGNALQTVMLKRTGVPDGVWDAGEVFPESNIYVGSLGAVVLPELQKRDLRGVLTVASCLDVWDGGEKPEDVKNWLQVDVADHPGENLLKVMPKCFEFIDRALSSEETAGPSSGILIHCASGVSRSVSICCAYLMTKKGMRYDEALAAVQENRPRGRPNPGFARQLEILQACACNLECAIESWEKESAKLGPIMDRIRDQRDEATTLKARVDNIAEALIQRENSKAPKILQFQRELLDLRTEVAKSLDQKSTFEDRPAKSIKKAAVQQIEEILATLNLT
ncbi:hypothetical protein CYMTET_40642 [Cymbomonas tetramitiformis]|uniref:Protein-tyrosine-phosphatase n=1 Tax=Cymbomonas tetramitiformis TaxID=36881 RepID=A0AAE0C7L0_9CHLO|nr:hypothetical protein CYMTET_40642 [Cymbomonas tetramitiformis]